MQSPLILKCHVILKNLVIYVYMKLSICFELHIDERENLSYYFN